MTTLRVIDPGPHTSVQAAGVRGRAHLGWSLGGAADERALALANLAVGNAPAANALECTLTGPVLETTGEVVLAWAGAPGVVRVVDGVAETVVAARTPTLLAAGTRIACGPRTSGVRAVLAFAGAVMRDVGTVLTRGLDLPLGPRHAARDARAIDDARVPGDIAASARELDDPLRVTASLHSEALAPAFARFTREPFIVTPDAGRRGVRLTAVSPLPALAHDLPSFGVMLGAVQLPPSGHPILLGVDQTTTGGYPLLATVIRADAWRIGQLRPGAAVRFERVTHDAARAAWLACRADRSRAGAAP